MLLQRATHSHRRSGAGNHRGGFWRLLSCTEGSVDDDEVRCDSDEDRRRRRATDQGHLIRKVKVTHGRPAKSSCKHERRQIQKIHCDTTDEITSKSSYTDELLLKPRQRHRRRHDIHHCSMRSGASGGRASVLDKTHSKSTRANRSKRRKRLVVAMLEDGGNDGATDSTRSEGYVGKRMLRMRKTRDERKIRNILHQLSASISTSDERQPEFASSFIRANKSPVSTTRIRPQALPSVQSPSMPLVPPPKSPTAPPPEAQIAAIADRLIIQPSQLVQLNSQQIPQQLPASEQALNLQSTRNSYGVKHFPSAMQPLSDSVYSNGRHGYRLFRRVFSASDNYYAVPFSPLESVKLSKDDDQWEDLEIFVASHKGTETIKPKIIQSPKKITNQAAKNHLVAATLGKVSIKPRAAAATSAAARAKPEPMQKAIETFGKLKPQQPPSKPTVASRTTAVGMDHETGKSLQQKKPVKSLLPVKKQQPTASQLLPPAIKALANNRPEVSKTQFNYMNRQQQLAELHQQRRADPLSPHLLLSQLTQKENPKKSSKLPTPSILPRPLNPYASQIPLFRSEPTTISGRVARSYKCGQLNTTLLSGLRPK